MFKLPLDMDGTIAALCYLPTRSQSLIEFYHTEIPIMYRHQGIGDLLLSRAFQWAKSSEKTVIPTCSFVRKYLKAKLETDKLSRHPSERHQVTQIENYVIYQKTIGAGSMGKVKIAECLTENKRHKYAVKIMPKIDLERQNNNESKDPKDTPQEREQRTIREMAIMRLLRHPNICQLKEYLAAGENYYMFLEYVDGGQLLEYIVQHGRLKEKQARKFSRQIISALDYCHRNSIVHRDLKIENILITRSEQIKIIDFGLSNVYSPNRQLDTFCGSLYFAAPELLQAKEYVGPEVDVWSFGVVLYVLVCGRVPFDDINLPALHERIKSGQVDPFPDSLGKDCIDLLTKIFVVNPQHRITLAQIRKHPWINKGYDEPIQNHLPHRQPLETIDTSIVQGMQGFGLGDSEAIRQRLEKIIQSSAYQSAASQIDENFVKRVNEDQVLARRPRWRRRLSSASRIKHQAQDDFRSLPAMYDPLVSIYYLVKERRDSEARKEQLLNQPSPAPPLTRSTSVTTHSKPKLTLTRRRTMENNAKEAQPTVTPTQSSSVPVQIAQSTTSVKPRPSWKRISSRLNESAPTVSDKQTPAPFYRSGSLFRLTPTELSRRLMDVLVQLQIEAVLVDPQLLQCSTFHWSKFLNNPHAERAASPLKFSLTIYTARWSSKIGFKLVKQDEVSVANFYTKEVFKNLYPVLIDKV